MNRFGHLHTTCHVVVAGLFVVACFELSLAAVLTPVELGGRANVLLTPVFCILSGLLPIVVWARLRGALENNATERFERGLLVVAAVGALLYAVLVWDTWFQGRTATLSRLELVLGQPWWALTALLVLTSACYTLGLGLCRLLERTLTLPSGGALGLSALVGFGLWLVSLNGLAVLVAGGPLWGGVLTGAVL